MKSMVLLYVDHGDTTDPVTQLIDDAFFVPGASVFNYELAVDVTEDDAALLLQSFIDNRDAEKSDRHSCPKCLAFVPSWHAC
jgi:hypothetical protein